MSSSVCKTEKELSDAIKNKHDEIIIEGDLSKRILRVKATGKVAWGVCFASLAATFALIATLPTTTLVAPPAGVIQSVVALPVAAPAATVLGASATTALTISVCAGSVGVLTSLRNKYKIIQRSKTHIVLRRR